MENDELIIDPTVIELTRVRVRSYLEKQKNVMEEYRSKIHSLAQEWEDDSGFGEMEKSVSLFCKNAVQELESMDAVYWKFLTEKALDIRKNLAAIGKK